MSQDSFLECDRISQGVDDIQFERLRWREPKARCWPAWSN